MKTEIKRAGMGTRARRWAMAGVVCAGLWAGAGGIARAQTVPADFSPGLQQIVNLSKGGMSDDFIHTYITNSGRSYTLSVDDIIYLHQQGVSDSVIQALMQPPSAASANVAPASPAPVAPSAPTEAAAPPVTAPDASEVAPAPAPVDDATPPTLTYYQTQLSPYGTWVNVAGYGQCWEPAVAPGWRPYCDGGHWVYTDSGWFWQSDYVWGGITFHYGRWTYTNVGWVWVPGYDYAPAWVVWRHADADGYVGWAPLPPGALFVGGSWLFNGVVVGADYDFGLGATFFTFVDYGHFCAFDFHPYILRSDRFNYVFHRSVFENHFAYDHGRFINQGLGRERVAAFTHQDIRIERAQDLRRADEQRRGSFQNYNRNDAGHSFGQPRSSGQFQSPNQGGGHGGGQGQFHGSLNNFNHDQMGGGFSAPNQVQPNRDQFSQPLAARTQFQYGGHDFNLAAEQRPAQANFQNVAWAGNVSSYRSPGAGGSYSMVHPAALQGGGHSWGGYVSNNNSSGSHRNF